MVSTSLLAASQGGGVIYWLTWSVQATKLEKEESSLINSFIKCYVFCITKMQEPILFFERKILRRKTRLRLMI